MSFLPESVGFKSQDWFHDCLSMRLFSIKMICVQPYLIRHFSGCPRSSKFWVVAIWLTRSLIWRPIRYRPLPPLVYVANTGTDIEHVFLPCSCGSGSFCQHSQYVYYKITSSYVLVHLLIRVSSELEFRLSWCRIFLLQCWFRVMWFCGTSCNDYCLSLSACSLHFCRNTVLLKSNFLFFSSFSFFLYFSRYERMPLLDVGFIYQDIPPEKFFTYFVSYFAQYVLMLHYVAIFLQISEVWITSIGAIRFSNH
jgi:hypothetical protein